MIASIDDPNLRPASFLQDAVLLEGKDSAEDVPGMPRNYGRYPVVHSATFQSYLSSGGAKAFRDYDEAVKASLDNARFMRNDCGIMECLEARQRMVALLDWHLVPEDEKDSQQKEWAAKLTQMIKRIRRFTEFRRCLQEGIWYGKAAIQIRYGWANVGGCQYQIPKPRHQDDYGWRPIHGDKLVFRQDRLDLPDGAYAGQLGIRVGNTWQIGDMVRNTWRVEQCDRGMAYFLRPWERDLLCVHKHMIEDAAYENALDAGAIHGVGIRSRIYWEWVQKQETLGFLMDYLERSAGGIEMWMYPQGNPQAKAEVENAARNRARGQNVMLVPMPMGAEGNQYGVQVVEPGMGGIEQLKDIVHNYYGHRTKRYILGQTLTSEADATGLGSGMADLHLDTLMQIIRYDANNLDETLTYQLVEMLQKINLPESAGCHIRFKSDVESPDVEKRLEAYARAYEMGARISEREVLDTIGSAIPGPDDRVLVKQEQQAQNQADGGPAEPDERLAGMLQQEVHNYLQSNGAARYGRGWSPEPEVRSSTQFNFEGPVAAAIRKMGESIPDADLAEDGRETEPHVTVKYGLHADTPGKLPDIVKAFGPVTVRFGNVSLFKGDKHDVVKIEIEGEDIRRLNKLVSDGMEHTDTFPDYQPHATIAYVKPGKGDRYVGPCSLTGKEVEFRDLVFSNKDRDHSLICLHDDGPKRYSRGWKEGDHPRDDDGRFASHHAGSVVSGDFDSEEGDSLRDKAASWAKRELVGKSFKNTETGVPIQVSMRSVKKTLTHLPDSKPALALKILPKLLEVATEDHVAEPREKDQNIKAWHYMKASLEIDGEPYETMLKVREDGSGHFYYDQHVTDIQEEPENEESSSYKPEAGDESLAGPADEPSDSIDTVSAVGKRKSSELSFEDAKERLLEHEYGRELFDSARRSGELAATMNDVGRQSLKRMQLDTLKSLSPSMRKAFFRVQAEFEGDALNNKIADIDPDVFDAIAEQYRRLGEAMKYSKDGEKWITIGGSDEGDGGTPVKVDGDGKIVAGPDGLAKKGIDHLDDFGQKPKPQKDQEPPTGNHRYLFKSEKAARTFVEAMLRTGLTGAYRGRAAAILDPQERSEGVVAAANELRGKFVEAVNKAFRDGVPQKYRRAVAPDAEPVDVDVSRRSAPEKKAGWQKVGGSSVYVNGDGKITKGCPGLKGEHISDLKDESDDSRQAREARQAHAEAKGITGREVTATEAKRLGGKGMQRQYAAAKQAAKSAGVSTREVIRMLQPALEHLSATEDPYADARSAARRMTGMNAGRLAMLENNYRDSGTLPGLDSAARSLAIEHPELGWDPDDDNSAAAWELIRGGDESGLSIHSPEVAEMAARLVKEGRSRMSPLAVAVQDAMDEWIPDEWDAPQELETVPF